MLNSKEKYVIEFASERAEGKIEGKQEMAKELIADGMSLEKVSKFSKLSIEIVTELAREISEESPG